MSTGRVSSLWVGALRGVGGVVSGPDQFVLAGVEWVGSPEVRIELRALDLGGKWSRWVNASVQGHDSDGSRGPAHALFGEPVWTGPAAAAQLRSSEAIEGVTVHLVSASLPAGRLTNATDIDPRVEPAIEPHLEASVELPSARAGAGYPLASPRLDAGPGQPAIIARAAWAGEDHPPRYPPEYGDVRMAFVHHSAGANGYSAGQVPEILLSIYEYHTYVRGWWDIGYNFAIDAFGGIWEAREGGIDQAVVGAQAGGYNEESTGAVVLGTYTSVLPSKAALSSLEHLIAWKLALHGVPVTGDVTVEVDPPDAYWTAFAPGQHVSLPRVAGHRQGCTTDCPGNALFGYLPEARTRVTSLAGKQVTLSLRAAGQTDATYLSLASVHVPNGTAASLSGSLRTLTGVGRPGVEIQLQSLVGQTEAVVGAATTDSNGDWVASLTPAASMLLRALAPNAPATASPLMVIATAPALTLALQQPGSTNVTGTVTPWKKEVILTVREASGKQRVVLTRTVITTQGKFSHGFSLNPGNYVVQAHTLADARDAAGWSAKLPLVVSAIDLG